MKHSLLIFILTCLFICEQNTTKAQQPNGQNPVLYASQTVTPQLMASSSTPIIDVKTITTIPVNEEPYFNSYYGSDNFEVYAGASVNQSLLYIKVVSHFIGAVTIEVQNSNGDEVSKFTGVNHPLTIGYGYKPGIYLIHVSQGKKEMVLRFSKGV